MKTYTYWQMVLALLALFLVPGCERYTDYYDGEELNETEQSPLTGESDHEAEDTTSVDESPVDTTVGSGDDFFNPADGTDPTEETPTDPPEESDTPEETPTDPPEETDTPEESDAPSDDPEATDPPEEDPAEDPEAADPPAEDPAEDPEETGDEGEDTSPPAEDPTPEPCEPVTIADNGLNFEVILDYNCGVTRKEMGYLYAEALYEAVPNIEPMVDSYLTEQVDGNSLVHFVLMLRIGNILPQVPQEFRDEMDGMIDYVINERNGGSPPPDSMNDGRLGANEFRFLNLFPDVGRATACSGVSVFGSRSATGKPIIARVLDWDSGDDNQLNQIQAITTIRNGSKSMTIMGYLGMLSVITAFNEDGVFAGILDSDTGVTYPMLSSNSSYVFDLRYAMENFSTMAEVSDYMTSGSRSYAFNHNILLGDKTSSGIVENNVSGSGSNMRRALRTWDSDLHSGINWGFEDAVGVVNSFLLEGNHENHTGSSSNRNRWSTMKDELASKGSKVTKQELTEVTYDSDMYIRSRTQHIVIFEPDTLEVDIFFHPRSGSNPGTPTFNPFDVQF